MKHIALYATDTMADWEYAYLTTQLAQAETMRPGRFSLMIVGDGPDTVTSMGGFPIGPTHDLDDLSRTPDLAAVVIPGGETYAAGHDRLLAALPGLLERSVPIAAICGATFLLARAGFLDDRAHTSNALEFLRMSGYTGEERYLDAPVVTDRGITTGSGVRPVPFTAEVFRLTGLYPDSVITAWERLHTTGDPAAYFELMEATVPGRTPEGDAVTRLILPAFALNGEFLDSAAAITAPHDLTPAQWQVLGAARENAASVADIARILGLARQSVQRVANDLVARSWARWAENPAHQRAKLLCATASGEGAIEQLAQEQHRWANRVGDIVGIEKLNLLLGLVEEVTAASRQASASIHRLHTGHAVGIRE